MGPDPSKLLWLPPMMQAQSSFCACDRLQTSVRLFEAAISEAAGRYGDPRIGSKSLRRAIAPVACCWFPRSRSVRSFCPFGSSLSHTSSTRRHADCCFAPIMERQPVLDPYNFAGAPTWPRPFAPSYWPVQSPSASLACAPLAWRFANRIFLTIEHWKAWAFQSDRLSAEAVRQSPVPAPTFGVSPFAAPPVSGHQAAIPYSQSGKLSAALLFL